MNSITKMPFDKNTFQNFALYVLSIRCFISTNIWTCLLSSYGMLNTCKFYSISFFSWILLYGSFYIALKWEENAENTNNFFFRHHHTNFKMDLTHTLWVDFHSIHSSYGIDIFHILSNTKVIKSIFCHDMWEYSFGWRIHEYSYLCVQLYSFHLFVAANSSYPTFLLLFWWINERIAFERHFSRNNLVKIYYSYYIFAMAHLSTA